MNNRYKELLDEIVLEMKDLKDTDKVPKERRLELAIEYVKYLYSKNLRIEASDFTDIVFIGETLLTALLDPNSNDTRDRAVFAVVKAEYQSAALEIIDAILYSEYYLRYRLVEGD